jgi:hypothetical protein
VPEARREFEQGVEFEATRRVVDGHRAALVVEPGEDREAVTRSELARSVVGGDRRPPARAEARCRKRATFPLCAVAEDVAERLAVVVQDSGWQDRLVECQLGSRLGREQWHEGELVGDSRVQEVRGRLLLTRGTVIPVERGECRLGAPRAEDRQQLGGDEPRGLADDVAVVVARLGRDADVLTGEVGAERAVDEDRVRARLGRREKDVKVAPREWHFA